MTHYADALRDDEPDALTKGQVTAARSVPLPAPEPTRKPTPADLVPTEDDPDPWVNFAACRGADPDLFYPGQGESTREAKAVCAGCHVREQCLAYALEHREKFGIWGGTAERERRVMRRGSSLTRTVRCRTCGKVFEPNSPTNRYCSVACREHMKKLRRVS